MTARYDKIGGIVPQGISAELIAEKWGLTREDLDTYSPSPSVVPPRPRDEGRFDNEIIPVQAKPIDKETGKPSRPTRS